MFEKTYKDFTFIVNTEDRCFLRVNGNQGKPLAFTFTTNELEEFQKTVDWTLGKMYKLEKVNYDAKLEEAHSQLKLDL